MKKRIELAVVAETVKKFAADLGGVFSYADLANIIAGNSLVKTSRIIKRLINNKILAKVQRGIYTIDKFDIWMLASRLEPECYISMDSVLAREGVISTVPAGRVSAVYTKPRTKRIRTKNGDIAFHSISGDLFFGFERQQNGVQIAAPEKAYLDMLYFYMKGQRFVIDPLSEVNLSKLNRKKILEYLRKYKNRRFVKFVEGLL